MDNAAVVDSAVGVDEWWAGVRHLICEVDHDDSDRVYSCGS
jgi:hypothetical protein